MPSFTKNAFANINQYIHMRRVWQKFSDKQHGIVPCVAAGLFVPGGSVQEQPGSGYTSRSGRVKMKRDETAVERRKLKGKSGRWGRCGRTRISETELQGNGRANLT